LPLTAEKGIKKEKKQKKGVKSVLNSKIKEGLRGFMWVDIGISG
jgi:hypothetical protein